MLPFSRLPLSLVSLPGLVVGASLLVACGGATESGKASSAQSATTVNPPCEEETKTGLEPEPLPLKPDAALADIQARCNDAVHGPADPYASFGELKTRIHGRWFACNRADATGLYAKEAAIQFTANGTWNLLHEEADGSFTTLHGVESQGTWQEKYTGYTGYFQVDWVSGQNGMVLTTFDFETSPTRLRVSVDDGAPIWFVPMGQ